MRTAVALPALFRLLRAHRPFLAVADKSELSAGYPHGREKLFDGFRPPVPQGKVVFLRSTLICMTFDEQLLGRIMRKNLFDDVHVILERHARVRADGGLVEVKQRILEARQALIEPEPFLGCRPISASLRGSRVAGRSGWRGGGFRRGRPGG